MTRDEAQGIAAVLQRMLTDLNGLRGWLDGQTLERGLQRLPVQSMHAAHQIDEMLLSIRKFTEKQADPLWRTAGYSSPEDYVRAQQARPEG